MPTAPKRLTTYRTTDTRPAAHKRGYDHNWNRLRNAHIAAHPLCEDCLIAGMTRGAEIVDHVEPIDRAPHRRLDQTNLRSLCRPCHKLKTDRDKGRAKT